MSHLCGLCLGLRDHAGQSARVTTNVDAVVLSVLVAAQRTTPVATRTAGPCPLRGMRTAAVPPSDDVAVRHAASVSLTMAATKVDDHVLDGDGAWTRVPVLPRAVAARWQARGTSLAGGIGFDDRAITEAVASSNDLEQRPGLSFADYVGPTEAASAAAFRHTAVLADRPENVEALDRLGTAFGRIVYLIDAAEDLDDDLAGGQFNTLVASLSSLADPADPADPAACRRTARSLFAEAHTELCRAFAALALERPDLARALLVDQVRRAGDRVLGHRPGHACRTRRSTGGGLRPVADLGVAGVAAVALGAYAFKPEGPSFPTPSMPTPEDPSSCGARLRRWQENCCGCCDCGDCCCCCCDGSDCACGCCDCCDCGDC